MTLPEWMARSVDGVLAMDGAQRVIYWNPACERLTGIPAGEALGRYCHEVVRGRDAQGHPLCGGDCPVGQLHRGGPSPGRIPMHIDHRNGSSARLCVGTLLMPSGVGKEWTVVHVLSHDCASAMIDATADTGPRHTAVASQASTESSRDSCVLTRREREMLLMLARGMKTDCIAHECHLSIATVRNHIQRMMAKLDVHTQLEAAAYAHRHGLV